ncbi:MAG: hypothetical protein ACRDA5_04905 [Clostridium sp.]
MKNLRKKTLISTVVIVIIGLFGIVGYMSYITNKTIGQFSTYVAEYKQIITTCILNDNQETYEKLIIESEQAMLDKDSKKVKELELQLNQFKEDLLESNSDLTNKNIAELDAIDINKLDDKELIISKIDAIKNLRDKNNFINANTEFIALKNDINANLELIKQEEIKKVVEEQKKKEANKVQSNSHKSIAEKGMKAYLQYRSSNSPLVTYNYITQVEWINRPTKYSERRLIESSNNNDEYISYIFTKDVFDGDAYADNWGNIKDFDYGIVIGVKTTPQNNVYELGFSSYSYTLGGGYSSRYSLGADHITASITTDGEVVIMEGNTEIYNTNIL